MGKSWAGAHRHESFCAEVFFHRRIQVVKGDGIILVPVCLWRLIPQFHA
jgi:hypothetical protein